AAGVRTGPDVPVDERQESAEQGRAGSGETGVPRPDPAADVDSFELQGGTGRQSKALNQDSRDGIRKSTDRRQVPPGYFFLTASLSLWSSEIRSRSKVSPSQSLELTGAFQTICHLSLFLSQTTM